jgi:hypothetical protein
VPGRGFSAAAGGSPVPGSAVSRPFPSPGSKRQIDENAVLQDLSTCSSLCWGVRSDPRQGSHWIHFGNFPSPAVSRNPLQRPRPLIRENALLARFLARPQISARVSVSKRDPSGVPKRRRQSGACRQKVSESLVSADPAVNSWTVRAPFCRWKDSGPVNSQATAPASARPTLRTRFR